METAGAGALLSRSVLPNFAAAGQVVRPLCVARMARRSVVAAALEKGVGSGNGGRGGAGMTNSNYVVPLDTASSLTRPLNEILRDLNKRVPDQIIDAADNSIPWYHTNRMLSFFAPGWCGEVRDVVFSDNGNVTVVYRVTIRGSDGVAHRESTGTVSMSDGQFKDPVAAAEELAFCKACARFGFGLYLYHEDEATENKSL
ncbi:DNA repair RAD52-like protein 2, chloroplastic [Musa acuminata AAA Group]|uniref:DNA repair RAD52-like protein 2, chloroplastic n=1 Tax=Musa acuminata AAA Group TaxID=214697 RepID=UPI0031CE8A86